MAVPVIMPRQGQSVESCVLTQWSKKVGDAVKKGDILFTYETDKSTFEEESKVDGTLLAAFFDVDDDVPCLANVAVIGEANEDYSQFDPRGGGAIAQAPAVAAPQAGTAAAAPVIVIDINADKSIAVSPRARVAAQSLMVNATAAIPTGPNGRVIERDVIALANDGKKATPAAIADMIAQRIEFGTGLGGRITTADIESATVVQAPSTEPSIQASADYEDQKLSNIRRVIAKSMQQSLASMAQLTHNSSFDATSIQHLRATLKAAQEKLDTPSITINDIVLFAVSRILPKHPELNAHLLDDKLRLFKHVHIGMAVDTPRGLLVPTLFNADTKSLREISMQSKALAKAAHEGSINPDLLTGATFTVSNLGALGIESFTPIINPPQTGILGVDCIIERVRTVDGQITAYPAMGLSLTYDHRAVDGAPASRFLKELCVALENIEALLVI
ncbi:MAG: dihydrolipoamide acetyltransferase family protein [Clostridia bacterium]